MLYELAAALVVVSVFVPWSQLVVPSQRGSRLARVLAVACTVVPQVWIIYVLRTLSPFTVAVTVNLEPVYALLLAALLFHETLSLRFYLAARRAVRAGDRTTARDVPRVVADSSSTLRVRRGRVDCRRTRIGTVLAPGNDLAPLGHRRRVDMQRAKKIGYVVALVFGASAMSGISAAQSPQPQDTPQQNNMPPQKDMPQKNDMPKDTSPPSDMPQKNDIPKDTDTSQQKDQSQAKAAGPSEVMAEKMSATATVTKINTSKRQLMLKDDQGHQFELDVPEKVTGFDQIKKGDNIRSTTTRPWRCR